MCAPVPGGGDRPESISITTIPDFHPAVLICQTGTGIYINLQKWENDMFIFQNFAG
jgi:hypothetical protein